MRKKRRLKKSVKIFLGIIGFLLSLIIIYKIGTGRVSRKADTTNIEIEQGETYSSIADTLKENKLIKSEFFYKLYIKFHKPMQLNEGIYELSGNMNVKTLVNTLENEVKSNSVVITFKEGINYSKFTSIISEKFGFTENEISEVIGNVNYQTELIKKYWFLTDDIKKEGIYYPLEGFLFPDTYHFNKKSSIKQILEKMLDNTESKLNPYKKDIKNNKYSIYEIMTMASVVELEASNSSDRAGVAGVFFNRLENGWSLGSDVTTYYGLKLALTDRDLTTNDLNSDNGYNTRNSKMAGKLPIGPICMPGLESIKATIDPTKHDYFYFVADKTGKTYFTKTAKAHSAKVSELKKAGLWIEY